jgi:hypothetical protein
MTTAADLCGRGFLPRELPPPFTSASLGVLVSRGWTPPIPPSSLVLPHNLFRWGALRRPLSIPNPLAYVSLAKEVESRWPQLQPILSLSKWSLSTPVPASVRALEPRYPQGTLLVARAAARAGNRYAVRADISKFYHTIYTHTLEWAAHGKQSVKQNRNLPRAQRQSLWGRGLDDRHRDLQDKQSVGIPIGPDTSLAAAELLLSRVDDELHQRIPCRGVRYIDDYEMCFPTLASAEQGLAGLQETLAAYELTLNPSKTQIVELPSALEPHWIRQLRRIKIRQIGRGQRSDLVDMFDTAFELRHGISDAHVLRYAMGAVRNVTCLSSNWDLLQGLFLQSVVTEPGILREVLSELVRYSSIGYKVDKTRVASTLSLIVERHGPLGHGSEVAWAMWTHIQLGIPIDSAEL